MFKKIFISCLVIYSILLIGCPSRTEIEKAGKWGYETTERTRMAQGVVLELYQGNIVPLSQKDVFFDAASKAFDVLEVWNDEVERQNALIVTGTQTSIGAKEVLKQLLSSSVLDTINNLIVSLNILDSVKAGKLFQIIRPIASGLLKVIDVLGVKNAVLTPIKA